MATCKKIRRVSKRVCVGALNRQIVVNLRTISFPKNNDVDFNEEFTAQKTVWANVVTIDGVVILDDTNTAREVSHDVYIRYILNTTAEKWVKLISVDGTSDVYLDILRVENLNEENRFLRLRCALRGNVAKPVNFN